MAERPGPAAWLAARFRRVTTSGRYIPEIDGLRFVAIVAVFLYHLRGYLNAKSSVAWSSPVADDWLARLTHYGNVGVPLFFVLSGFILGLPFAAHALKGHEPVSLRAYFLRRLTRLEPPYLVSLTAFLVLLRVVNHAPWGVLLPGYLSSMFYAHNQLGNAADTIQSVGWSLEIEVQFYVIAPWLARVFKVPGRLQRRSWIVGLALLAVVAQRLWVEPGGALSLTVLNYLQYFLGGFLVADLYLDGLARPGTRAEAFAWDVVALAAWAGVIASHATAALAAFALPLLFTLLTAATFRGNLVRRALCHPAVTAIGGMCYSIYLVHFQLISLLGRFTKDLPLSRHFGLNMLMQTALVGLPVLALSAVFFLLVEKPCMRKDWPQRLARWAKRRFSPAPEGDRGPGTRAPEL